MHCKTVASIPYVTIALAESRVDGTSYRSSTTLDHVVIYTTDGLCVNQTVSLRLKKEDAVNSCSQKKHSQINDNYTSSKQRVKQIGLIKLVTLIYSISDHSYT